MAKSMTAYGRARGTACGKDITVEIKSVNNRFFDCSVKLPRAFSFLEERVKPYLSSRSIARGKVDVFISIDVVDSPEVNIALDAGYAERYIAALRELGERFSLVDDISVMSVAQNRDIFIQVKPEEDMESDWQAVRSVLDGAIDSFIAAREREGANIARDLLSKIDNIERIVSEIDTLSQCDTKSYRQKLEERLREMLADNRIAFDENRILTECAIFADKVALDEELVRLRSHFEAFRQNFESSEPVGRRLDFLTQELNREINTIGSKASNSAITQRVVDVKCELEKIREQIQNLE
ncbi:MAG: YicC family protein [Clostridia bacterium]|nr:YicC family protein [Clostridia bacterium]